MELLYLHFGRQCPGRYFAEQAAKAATVLQLPFRIVDIGEHPDLAERYGVCYPGTVVIGDWQLVYPGSAEQMVESYRRRGPLPGVQSYRQKPSGEVERVEVLGTDNCGQAFGCCVPGLSDEQRQEKASWLSGVSAGDGFAGLVGWFGESPVGFVEVLPEPAVPYPLGEKQADRAFITCLYSPIEWGLERDYRASLLDQLFVLARQHGYRAISVVSGLETPYPNGPVSLFEQFGFERVKFMGSALLRHKWEDAWLLHRQLVD